ncbi:Pre-mRNA processing ribonucleoprotein [Methanothermococcus sp.]|uniref:Pre-mRNA processing ribonucleoprotein n=1 Tax=Methanothermococcus sp. TaxID=2614238 RepID=UPI0025CBFCFB|nr:Pre-mRNA processing ribonucleoprotein [Methanothermococcus sp.]
MIYLTFAPYGAFALESDGNLENLTIDDIKYCKIFEEEDIPKIMYDLRNGNFEIVEELKKEWNITNDEGMEEEINIELSENEPNIAGELIRKNLYELGNKYNVFKDYDDFIEKMNLWGTEFTKLLMKKSSEEGDKLIIQTVSALDDLDESLNLFSERFREWYSLYFPEMDKLIKKHELYVDVASTYTERDNYTRTRLKKSLPSKLARTLSTVAKKSMGAELSERDLAVIKIFAEEIKSMYNLRENLQKYLEELMEETAPNLTKMAGSSLGARLISLTGGIDRLSKLPASTIQVIGAEKALFAHLREGALPPKHGVIFQHPLLQSSPWWIKGKVARALACKLSIAVRADVFGNYIADELLEDLNKKVESIKEKYPEPRKKKPVRRDDDRRGKKGKGRGEAKGKGKGRKEDRAKGKPGGKGKDKQPEKSSKPKKKSEKTRQKNHKKDRPKTERKVIGKTSSKL